MSRFRYIVTLCVNYRDRTRLQNPWALRYHILFQWRLHVLNTGESQRKWVISYNWESWLPKTYSSPPHYSKFVGLFIFSSLYSPFISLRHSFFKPDRRWRGNKLMWQIRGQYTCFSWGWGKGNWPQCWKTSVRSTGLWILICTLNTRQQIRVLHIDLNFSAFFFIITAFSTSTCNVHVMNTVTFSSMRR